MPILDHVREMEAWLEKIQFLSDAMESTTQPFCAAGRDGSILIFNEAFCRLTDYTREELYDINWATDLTTRESLETEFTFLEILDRTHQAQRYEKEYRRKDGTAVPVELLVDLALDSEGHTLFYYAFITDITERKKEEERLQLTQYAVDHFTDSTIWLDQSGRIIYVNDVTCRSTEYTKKELLSMHIWDIDPAFSPERYALEWRRWEEMSRLQTLSRFESVHRTKSGKVSPVEISGSIFAFRGRKYYVSFDRDITERKQTEESLRLTQFSLDKFSDSAIWLSPSGSVVYVNETACHRLGYTREELLSMHIWDIDIERDYKPDLFKVNWDILKKKGTVKFESRHRTRSGEIFPVEVTASYIRYGEREYLISFDRDITERKQAEDALRGSEEKFRQMAENIDEVFFIFTPDWKQAIYVSPGYERVWGRPVAEVYRNPMAWLEAVCPEDLGVPLAVVNKHKAGKTSWMDREEFRIVKPDGAVRWIQGCTYPIRDKQGQVCRITGTAEDITERKQAEEALRESEEKFRVLAETTSAMIMLHQGTKILYVNQAIEDITGYSKDMLLSMNFWELAHPDFRELVKERGIARIESDAPPPPRYRTQIITRDGLTKWVYLNAGRVIYHGKPTAIVTMVDITEQKMAEAVLEKAKAQAELYLDLMGHDINNMHQIALGYLELAREMSPEAGQAEILDKSIKVLQRSNQLISNVSKLQKLTEGVLPSQVVDVCEVVAEVQREFGAVPNKKITLDLSRCGHCYTRVNELLHDVFANLVSNAIKHTADSANIGISLDIVEVKGSRYCQVSVEDDGPGIPDDLKARIFNRMLKGTGKAKGMGLGLYLVKTLVDSYDGRVWVEDRVRGDHTKGARFVVMLPVVGD